MMREAWKGVLSDCPVSMDAWKDSWTLTYAGMVGEWATEGSDLDSPHGKIALILELVSGTLRIHTEVTEGGHDLDKAAILCGDYLYTRALQYIPDLNHRGLEVLVHRAVVGASEGRLLHTLDLIPGSLWSKWMAPRRAMKYPGALAATAIEGCLIMEGRRIADHVLNRAVSRWLRGLPQQETKGLDSQVARVLDHWPR